MNRFVCNCILAAALIATIGGILLPAPKIAYGAELVPVVPEIPFGLIEKSGVILYEKDSTSQTFFPLTELPATYFVCLTEDYSAEYYRALYRDISGYIKKTDITPVDYEPVTKDALGTLVVTADVSGVLLRERPNHLVENVVAEIRRGESLHYYGKLTGTSPDPVSGSVWYYAITENGERGYLYAPYINAFPIGENIIEKVMRETVPEPSDSFEPNVPANSYITAAMIVALCVPAVIVMVLLFQKPAARKREPRF